MAALALVPEVLSVELAGARSCLASFLLSHQAEAASTSSANCCRKLSVSFKTRRILSLRLSPSLLLSPKCAENASNTTELACVKATGRSCVQHLDSNASTEMPSAVHPPHVAWSEAPVTSAE
eukprot:CAMPEP_0177181698 /NCGR_PEP_ID=MMETSP0367-20130122/16069_1 /TAXON_ID=447022 ORGANISM="Scrippsiella hangoei-like, Strain SHHI-4" /NCGR_SAMPLE_ID=MMETSP0367 /ASSEMBLY_ACC=CAM_ASM_000362 /LENGTH=121 /DNA_ID=CAMNT_0018628577 /DNA_START=372 /DNA_END=737 /DNA_ORIENTATION=+